MQVCQAAGLLLIGHSKGEARLYQYSSHPQDVTLAHISPESRWPSCWSSWLERESRTPGDCFSMYCDRAVKSYT